MTNYIEVEHEYKDSDEDTNWDIYYAVRPSADRYSYKREGAEVVESTYSNPWYVSGGHAVTVYNLDDIQGLRKLLDAIEVEIQANERKP